MRQSQKPGATTSHVQRCRPQLRGGRHLLTWQPDVACRPGPRHFAAVPTQRLCGSRCAFFRHLCMPPVLAGLPTRRGTSFTAACMISHPQPFCVSCQRTQISGHVSSRQSVGVRSAGHALLGACRRRRRHTGLVGPGRHAAHWSVCDAGRQQLVQTGFLPGCARLCRHRQRLHPGEKS